MCTLVALEWQRKMEIGHNNFRGEMDTIQYPALMRLAFLEGQIWIILFVKNISHYIQRNILDWKCDEIIVWGNWAVKCIMFCLLKVHSIRIWGHFPVGWLVRSRGLPTNMDVIGGSHLLTDSLAANVGLHLRLGCLLASYPDQVLMSIWLWENWFLALSSGGLPWFLGNF